MMSMTTQYQPSLVLLSFLVAIFAAFVALELVASVSKAVGFARVLWLTCGAFAMGVGIWSMHFIGMLALEMPGMAMSYDIVLMVLSIFVAVAASGLGLYVMSRPSVPVAGIIASASAMAIAIAGMHYIGMYSMRMPARIEWNYFLVALSVVIALIASLAAVLVAIRLPKSEHPLRLQTLASISMGIAIAGMHYTGMEAATFIHAEEPLVSSSNVIASSQLTTVVTLATLAILVVALIGAMIDRALTRRTTKANENARLYQEAEAANVTKTRFLANMSHEIRTPLSAITGFTELLLEDDVNADQRKEYLNIVLKSAKSLSQLIDDILDLSKIEMGRLEVEITTLEIRKFVQEILSLLRLKAEQKGLLLQFIDDVDAPSNILTDAIRLRQILVNVIGNAIKFTSSGHITLRLRNLSTQLSFEVSDTGIGMNEEQQQRIFRAFSQADSSMTRKFGGTGLGLDISRRLARALGGDLQLLHSQPNHGSTFLITIQTQLGTAAPPSLEKSETLPTSPGSDLAQARVLFVDDVPDNQILVRLILQRHGAFVEFADNGKDAVEKAQLKKYDIILMDIQMPIMNGYEATRTLRAQGFKTPIIALTAHAMSEDRDACLAAGCDDYLTKPIDVNELIPKIRDHLRRSRGAQGSSKS